MNFQFTIKIREHATKSVLGDLKVVGATVPNTGQDSPEIIYKKIIWDGNDILPLLDNLSGCDEAMQYIFNEITQVVEKLLKQESNA